MQFNRFDMDMLRHGYVYHHLQPPYGLPVHMRPHAYPAMLPSAASRAMCTCECYCMGNLRASRMMPSMEANGSGLDPLSEQDPKHLEVSESEILSADKSGRRNRTTYKRWQIDELERAFAMNPYPTSIFKKTLAMRLGLRDSRVQVWFQNRRAKSKRERKGSAESVDHEMLRNADFCSVEHTLLFNEAPSQEIRAEETEISKSTSR